MSKLQFFEMRAEEIATIYDSTFTKKEAILTGKRMVDNLLESGEIYKMSFGANLIRLNEVISSAVSTFRDSIIDIDKQVVLGVEFNPVNGGNTINYADDEIYVELKRCLDSRVEQLKLAQKQDTFDAYGNQVPKVSTTPRKSSITVKF